MFPLAIGGGGCRCATVDGAEEDLEGAVDDGEFFGVETAEQLAQLALIQFAKALEQGRGAGCRGDDDLATVGRVIDTIEQVELDEAFDDSRSRTMRRSRAGPRARPAEAGRRP